METTPDLVAGLVMKVMEELTGAAGTKAEEGDGLFDTVNDPSCCATTLIQ